MTHKETFEWLSEGVSFFNERKYNEALRCFDRSLEIDPNDADTWYYKADTLLHMERYEEAIQAHHMVIELKPDYPGYTKEWCSYCGKVILVGIDPSILSYSDQGMPSSYHSEHLMGK